MLNTSALVAVIAVCCLVSLSTGVAAQERRMERGWMARAGVLQTFDRTADVDPIFGQWSAQFGGPLEVEFHGTPDTEYQVVVALRELYWQEPGKRLMDIQIGGTTVATVDSFGGPQGKPHAAIVRGTTNTRGLLRLLVKANPQSPDQNPAVCGFLLYAADAVLDARALVQGKGPKPLVTVNPADQTKRIPSIADGRLCFGNGYVFGTFVGPLEYAEEPVTQVHDKISRLWLGYATSNLAQVGLAPTIRDRRSGQEWTVRACDQYRVEDGVVIMETKLPIGRVRTETYGAWERPLFLRRIRFTPDKGVRGDFVIRTDLSLYRDFLLPEDEEALRRLQLCDDSREWPTPLQFPATETMRLTRNGKVVEWSYDNPLYRKVAIKSAEPNAVLSIQDTAGRTAGSDAVYSGDSAGVLVLERPCGARGGSLTVILAFDRDLDGAVKILDDTALRSVTPSAVQRRWARWYESGSVVRTGDTRLDTAYRAQFMSWKMALDQELGGHIVGGRYHIQTVWTRDAGVGVSVMLDAGHYAEVRRILRFFADHAYWNEKNNCLHANYHASGRVAQAMCAPGQAPVEEITQPGEWAMQMGGPQLDGMAYYLYNAGKYYRYTGDRQFVQELWPFVQKVADALAKDEMLTDEIGFDSGYLDSERRFHKYNPETGLIVDNVTEGGILREHLLMNALAVLGFREAYALSQVLGEERPLWARRAEAIDRSIRRHLIGEDGKTIRSHVPRPWLDGGRPTPLEGGYFWTCAATVPYLNYRDPLFRDFFARTVSADGKISAWGMWWATLAHAAFEADLMATGWNYLEQLAADLPLSNQIYEHSQDVVDSDGYSRTVTLNLYGFNYLTHAVIRGFACLGYDAHARRWFFRPQVPEGLGVVHSKLRIGRTWFHVTSSGHGDTVAEFRIDGKPQPLDGVLPETYLDGKTHEVVIRMTQRAR